MSDASEIGLTAAGILFLGFLAGSHMAYHHQPVYQKTYASCAALCAPNDGVEKVYIDGECDCVNGAHFEGNEQGE